TLASSSLLTRPACLPSASWLISITSSLVSSDSVNSSSCVMSHPISSGADNSDQSEMCVYCSSAFSRVGCRLGPQPTLPTTSMSGSFQCPGEANCSCPAWRKPIDDIEVHVSVMSSVVRQQFPPIFPPQVHTSPIPY